MLNRTILFTALLAGLLVIPAQAQQTIEPSVRFVISGGAASSGIIDVTLFPDIAPLTVANFMNYVNAGAYRSSIFHRLVKGFVLQGGGYTSALPPQPIAQNAAVQNEFKLSNTVGTIAMAKVGGDPNSATNQWFFNLADNSSNLDSNNGGFTVFGQVANATGLTLMNKLASASSIINYDGASLTELPVTCNGCNITTSNLLTITSIVQIPTTPVAGFVDAANYAPGTAGISPGQILTIFGLNMGPAQLAPLTLNSTGTVVTNSLAGTRVLFNGTPGAMLYSSNRQIGVIAPYNLAGKTSTTVSVEYQGFQAAAVTLPVVPVTPAILTLNSSGKGDGAIVNNRTQAIISLSNPARVGDDLLLYGEGYGAPTQPLPDGTIITTNLPIPVTPPVLLIDGQAYATQYAGGAPYEVNGVLQVNFRVPNLAPGSHQIQIQIGTVTSSTGVTLQTL